MFKKPEQIKPLPQGMADAFSRTLERQGFVAPAPVQQPAPQPEVVAESAMSELSGDLRSMSDKEFQAQYKMTKAQMRAKLKGESVTEAVKEVPPSDLAKSPNTVKGTVAHKLGVGLDMKQMMQHAKASRDIDIDGDVDSLDKGTPDEITGAEKENQTPKMMKKYEKEKQHTKVGVAFEAVDNGSCQCDNPDPTSKGNCSECGKPVDMSEALDPVDKKALKKDFSDRKDKDIDNDGDTDSSDEYLHKRRQAVSKALTKESATSPQNSLEEEDTFAGWIAIYKGKKIEIKKDQAKDLYGAKQLAIKQLKVPKSGVGVLAIKPAYESYEETQLDDIEEGWDDMMKAAKERAKPQPNGAGGKKQGTAYGGSKQKDAPKKDEMKESVKVGDKVSFDHPMTAAPGKTMKKVGTVKKIEGDTAHLKSSTKYGTLSYQKKVSELRKEEVELGEGIFDSLKKGYTNGLKTGLKQKIKPEHHKSYGIDDVKSTSDATSILQKAKQAGHTHVKEEVQTIEEAAVTKQAVIDSLVKGGFNKAEISKDVEKLFAQAVKSYPTANTKKIADVISSLRVNESLEVKEELKGDQHKLDKNKNGKLDAEDFKKIRKEDVELEEVQDVAEGSKDDEYGQSAKDQYLKQKAFEKQYDKKKKPSTPVKSKGQGMKEETAELAEAPSYKLYHTTFSAAVQEAIAVAKKQGFEVDEEDWQSKVATGPKKPSKDKTNSYTIDLTKGGSPTKKKLQIQVYNMGEKYELNTYVQ